MRGCELEGRGVVELDQLPSEEPGRDVGGVVLGVTPESCEGGRVQRFSCFHESSAFITGFMGRGVVELEQGQVPLE